MKNLGTTSVRNLFTTAIAMAALALPTGAHALTATYNALVGNLVNAPSDCSGTGNHRYNACSGAVGFNWTDTIPAGNTVSAVTVQFNEGVDCHTAGTVFSTTVNAAAAGTWTSSVSSCACVPAPVLKSVVVTAPGIAAYTRGGTNTFLTTSPITTCLGYSAGFNGFGAGVFGIVTVTYAATVAGGTDPWLTPLPGAYAAGQAGNIVGNNLDAKTSTRATQASVDTANANINTANTNINTANAGIATANAGINTANTNINTANTNINAIKAKTDANLDVPVSTRAKQLTVDSIETKVDNLVTKINAANDLSAQVAIERALSDHDTKMIPRYLLPVALGGSSQEAVRKVVTDAIAMAAAAGFDVTHANKDVAEGDGELLEGEYAHAFEKYREAYEHLHEFHIPK